MVVAGLGDGREKKERKELSSHLLILLRDATTHPKKKVRHVGGGEETIPASLYSF